MKTSQTLNNFNNAAYAKPWRASPINDYRVKKILSLVGTGNRVLDIGCYDGTIAKLIAAQGNQVVGIDIAKKAVHMARKNGIQAYVCNLEEDPFPKSIGTFDVIIAGEIIEHIFDPDALLNKLTKVLKPGGHLILTTPNLASLGSRLSLLVGHLPWMIENDLLPGKSGHIRYFTYSELEKILIRHSFSIETFTTDSVGLNTVTIPYLDSFFPELGRILILKTRKV